MTKRPYYESIARIGKALSNPERLRLVELLAQGERSVEELSRVAGQPVKSVSHHLQLLKRARITAARREGRRVLYSLANDDVASLWLQLRGFAEAHLHELRELARQRRVDAGPDRPAPVGLDRLEALLESDEVILVDVRPVEEFHAAHVAGAVAIPVRDLSARAPELRDARQVVVYCRGSHCSLADDAVRVLRAEGVAARRLDLGVLELRAARYPLETTAASL